MAKTPFGNNPLKEIGYYKDALENIAAITITDEQGVITYVNDNFCKLVKFSKEELTGNSINIIKSGYHSEEFYRNILETVKSRNIWRGEIKNKKKDGSYYCSDTTIIPIVEEKNPLLKFMIISFDISPVYQAGQIKNQFLANISHELKTPLHGIISTSEFLKETELDSKQTKFAELIKSSAETMLMMINNIIELTSIDAGNLVIENIDFNLHETVKSVAGLFGEKAAEKNLELIISTDKNIPDLLNGDSGKLSHVLFNLINNSVKFTIEGSINVSARLIEKQDNNYIVEFAVSDTGIGIPDDKKDTVFEKFTQIDNQNSRGFGGLGIGLSVSKELVKLMNGSINIESYIDYGTKVSFILNYGAAKQKLNEKKSKTKIGVSANEVKVLVVDDTQVNHFVAEKHLQKLGYKAQFSYDGFDAIEKISKGDFDIVMMDIQMPVMDGCETISRIRAELEEPKNKIPIIAVTANATDSEIKKYKKTGANEYLAKPYNSIELKKLIEKILCIKEDSPLLKEKKSNKSENKNALTDLKWLNEMSGGDKNLIIEMIKLFIDIVPGTIADFNKNLAETNWEGLRNIAHKYSTQVSYMGINSIIADVKNVEIYSLKQQNIEVIRKLIHKINSVSVEAVNVLKSISDNLKKEI